MFELEKDEGKKWSYCTKCISTQYFVFTSKGFVCEECGTPLTFATDKGTIVTRSEAIVLSTN